MTQATAKDYWISSNALFIERNALGIPDYIQASCVSGAQILVYIKDIIPYDAGHNYRRWKLQAAPTVFNTHSEKYIYVAIPRSLDTNKVAQVVFPSEEIDIYGKNEKEEQIGDEKYYYIFLQGILTSSGDNGTTPRNWKKGYEPVTGYLSSDEALASSNLQSEWYEYSNVSQIVTLLKDLTMKPGTKFRQLYAQAISILQGGALQFDKQGSISGIADVSTPVTATDQIATPKYVDDRTISKLHNDTAQAVVTFLQKQIFRNGMSLGNGESYVNGNGDAKLTDVVVDRIHDKNSTPSDRVIIGAQGFDFYMGDDGKSHLYVDYLTARTRMFASSVEIRKVSYSGGTTIFSNAGSTIAKVSYIWDAAKEKVIAYKCYAVADDGTTKTMNWWHVGMMALCQTFNVKAEEDKKLSNRYYWRMVVGVGQEKLDGKLYDYVILSNIKEFQGNLLTIPTYSDKTLANEQKKKLVWGNVMVEVTMDDGMQTLASLFQEQEGKDVDDNGIKIADRIFYGYDDEEPDVPAPYDVIVQVGDQIQWKKFGNVIKLSTSTEDNATDTAPAITMYHKLGAPHDTGNLDADGNKINPYQWKIITTIISPEKVMHNTDNFQLFQGTPDNIVDPITIMYDIVPSVAYFTRHPSTQTTTPTDITFKVRKRTGNKIETLSDAQIYAEYTLLNGNSATMLLTNNSLSDIGDLYQITSVKLKSTIKEADREDVVVTYDLPVLTDGVKGEIGADGDKGLDALEVTIKNAPLVFDTDDNGVVSSSAVQVAEIWARRDGKNVIADIKNANIVDSLNFTIGSDNAVIRKTSECLQIALKGIGIAKETVNGNAVSKTSGYVVVSFDDGNNMFYRQIVFNVNVARFNSSVIQTAKLYEQKYTEVSNKYEALPEEVRNKESFTEYNSTIKQTAREISLSVTEEAAKKRNLLVNSDFARNGGFCITYETRSVIERLSGYDGSNCIHTFTSSLAIYPIVRWEGVNNSYNNIPIVKGKKYTISCWVKAANTIAHFFVKVFRQAELTGNSASTTTDAMLDKEVILNAANTWQLVSFTFEATGDMSYASVRLYFQAKTSTRIDGYICKPMLEQADSYNGWTLSEEDYVYRNGNMLDNTRYLNTGGNLSTVGTITNNAKDNCSMSEASVDGTTSSNNLLSFANLSVQADTDYVLSFFARSKDIDSKANVGISLNLSSNIKFAEGSNGKVSSFTSTNGNSTTSGYIVYEEIPTDWTRFWYHFSAKGTVTNQYLAIQVARLNGAGTLQICQPKLEKAVTNTAWTEAKQDVAFKDKAKRAGIDLDSETIRLSAERTIIDGDLYLKGILVENYEDMSANNDLFIVCDMKAHKSVTVSHSRVILPMLDTHTIMDYNDKEYTVNGLTEAGVKLTIASKYDSYVAKWAQTTPSLFESYKNFDNRGLMKTYHNSASVVFADPRIANKGNYKIVEGADTLVPTILPEGGGGYAATNYEGGVFVCNGRRGRALVLMPGQTLHLTSAIEYVNEKQALVWYVDNSSDFVPLTKEVCFYSWDGYTYDHGFHSNGGNAFPMEVSGSSGSEYEDAIFGTKILDETSLSSSLHAYWGGFLTGYSD